MKTKWIKLAGAIAAALAITASVQATPINGSIGFFGTYTQTGGTLGNLTTATAFNLTSVNIAPGQTNGAFIGATSPTFASPIAVNPANNLVPNVQLWSVIVGSTTYRFYVTSELEVLDIPQQVNLIGTGYVSDGNSADDTLGTWQLGFGATGDSFTWQSTTATAGAVPDGGATVMLLGMALSGLALLKKKFLA